MTNPGIFFEQYRETIEPRQDVAGVTAHNEAAERVERLLYNHAPQLRNAPGLYEVTDDKLLLNSLGVQAVFFAQRHAKEEFDSAGLVIAARLSALHARWLPGMHDVAGVERQKRLSGLMERLSEAHVRTFCLAEIIKEAYLESWLQADHRPDDLQSVVGL